MRAHVIGNVALDETIALTVWPTPGASIFGRHSSSDLGGKGANQAIVMGRCGVSTRLVAAAGTGMDAITRRLADEPLELRLVEIPGKHSDFSIIFTMPDGENAIITTTDAAESLSPDDILPAIAEAATGDHAVFQGNLSEETTVAAFSAARARGLTTILNPSPMRPWFGRLWPLVDTVFLNAGEAFDLTGAHEATALARLHAQGVRDAVLTLGAEGALLSSGRGVIQVPACKAKAVDATGAGDTFMGVALASAIMRHTSLDATALAHAAQASAITVARAGAFAAFPSRQEMAEILAQG